MLKISTAIPVLACVLMGHATPVANLLASDAHAGDDRDDRRGFECHSRKLVGRYGFNAEGYNEADVVDPIGVVGVLQIDRPNRVTIEWRSSHRVSRGLPAAQCSGTFEVGRDCRGMASFHDENEEACPGPGHMDFVVTDCGKDIHFLFVDQEGLHEGDFHLSADAHRIDGRTFCK